MANRKDGDASENEVIQVDDCTQPTPNKRRSTKMLHHQPQQFLQQQQQQQQQQHHAFVFKAFTRESLVAQRNRHLKPKKQSIGCIDPSKGKPEPDPYLASGQQLPCALVRQLPAELIGKPIEDIDPYYADQETFVIISRGKELTRFSATKALYLLGPFHPIRRVVLYILVNPIFNLLVILTILINCILMTIQASESVEKTEIIFTIVYTTEMGLKVLARGFIVDEFTYLRDPWNWLDFAVIIMAYLTIVVQDLGNLSVIRTFRVLRALKTVAIIPGMKTIVGAVIDSVKNLKDVVVLTLFSLSVFSLSGLQIYMGQLTQKCILNGPINMTDSEWYSWCSNSSHWVPEPDDEIYGAYRLCGNATGAQTCPQDHTCIQGFGPNPDYGFTNFDTFGWALICSFRLMTQDFWEGLYMQVLKTAGSWHILFFIVSIFLGSIYLMNLILAIVAMSYNELQRRAEEEEEAAAEDEAAFLESCRLMELQDQMSEFSSSTYGGRSSYRPSVEIGLVGQSLLASMCRNGLLGQQMRTKMNQQMVLPDVMTAQHNQQVTPHNQSRSHSLCVNLDTTNKTRRTSGLFGHSITNSRKRSSVTPANYLQRHPSKRGIRSSHEAYNPPPAMAASMTELRRRSSIRTVSSMGGSPVHQRSRDQLDAGKPLTSPRGKQQHQYESTNLFPKQSQQHESHQQLKTITTKTSPQHHVSSGCVLGTRSSNDRAHDQSSGSDRRRSTRSSIKSDRDLSILRQRAALIKIGNDLTRDGRDMGDSLDMSTKSVSGDSAEDDRNKLSIVHLPSSTNNQANSSQQSSLPFNGPLACRRRSDMETACAIVSGAATAAFLGSQCLNVGMKARTKSHDLSLERTAYNTSQEKDKSKSNNNNNRKQSYIARVDKFRSEAAICKQPKSIHSHQWSIERPMSQLMTPTQSMSVATSNSRSAIPNSSFNRSNQSLTQQDELLGRQKSILSLEKENTDTTQVAHHLSGSTRTLHNSSPPMTMSSSGTAQQLAVGACLRQSNMNRLSVENFQQFGLSRPQNQLTLPNNCDDSASDQQQHFYDYDEMFNQQQQQHSQLRAAHRLRVGSRGHILPSTMIRSSFSRPRQSIVEDGGVSMGAKRMSTDFTRRASDWSRLSMSGNVDLRRLLRLWSHTNPYTQTGGRPSVCSYSNYSQTNGHSNNNSPAHSIKDFYNNPSYNNSPRPSSVGSARQAYELISAISRRRSRVRNNPNSRYAIPLDDMMSDQMSVNMRDKCIAYCLSFLDVLCIWECCGIWVKVQRIISIVVFDPFTELFIILCILINTLFMALDSNDADAHMKSIFERGNYFFTATFAVEASMKIMALSPKFYFREGWNVFDSIIVCLSLLELGLEGVYGLSVLRSFRLLRVFKLAKSWPTLNLLISIMGKAVGDLGNLTFVLAIIVFIFAVMGMQLFGNKYIAHNFPSGELPRWNFTDFMHSFMIVFRILCAEWIEPMWDCLLVGGWPCIPFFLIAVTVGNLVVLNLFLALLLASFGASNLSSPQADNVDTKKLQEAIARFSRFGSWTRKMLICWLRWLFFCLLRKEDKQKSNQGSHVSLSDASQCDSGKRPIKSHIVAMSKLERLKNIELRTEELKSKIKRSPEHHYHLRQLAQMQIKQQLSANKRDHFDDDQTVRYSSVGPGYNYNYKGKRSTSNQSSPLPPSIIPIIVDEATEGDEDERTSVIEQNLDNNNNNNTKNNNENAHQNQDYCSNYKQTSPTSIVTELLVSGEAADKPSENQALNDKSPVLRDDQVNCGRVAEPSQQRNSTENNSQIEQYALDHSVSCLKQSLATNAKHPTYFVNMHPIREDSQDADSSASLSEVDGVYNKSLDKLTQDEVQLSQLKNRRRKLSISKASYFFNDKYADRTSLMDDGELAQQQEHLMKFQEPETKPPDVISAHQQAYDQHQLNQSYLTVDYKSDFCSQSCGAETQEACAQDEDERPKSSLYLEAPMKQDMEEDDERALQHIETYIEKCICFGIICLKWFLFRQHVRKIVEHRYFDQCILVLIVISSGTLALEDKHLNERPMLKYTLDVLDTVFTIIFSLEMILKWLAFGIRRYFGNIWSWLDFVIVLVSFINLMASIFGSGKLQALKTIRTLRAMRGLRPLRALQRFQGMRVVVNALIQAIPSIFNVLLVCLIFWLIFSIMGVQMFGGKFWRCLNPETMKVVTSKEAANRHECLERNLTWANPQINFDNVLNAYLALFQVATFKGWIDIMNSATDSRTRDDQPIREANIYMYFYFVFFVIFGSFFTLNLFIGVIIDNFNEQKKKTGGSLEILMTDDQKKYYHAMKRMKSKKPMKAMTRPKLKLQAFLFDITISKKFDMAIMLIIGLNMFVMALEHYGQSQEFSIILENLNLVFIAIFTLECLCKVFAMRQYYFREPWNVFDFIVVVLSILGVVMKEYVAKYFVSPTLLRVVRVVKIGRVLRLVKGAKGIRTLLFALAMSLPALFNICLLLFLVMFIYAIFGMSFFMNVRPRAGIDETFNFHTFTSSIIVLFQMSTSAAWDVVLDPLMDEENDCQKPDPALGIEGTCGNKGIAIFYLISYVIVTFLIIINMYIAVILENYSQATEDVQEGLTDDDYEMYYEIWQKFDPNGTQYLPFEKLSDFVDSLEDPLRIAKPNDLALVVLDVNIYEGNQCYCVDILDALTKFFFTRKGLVIQVNEHLRKVQSTLHETPFERITTTYLVKRQHYCAKLIQNSWRRWKERTQFNPKQNDSLTIEKDDPTN